MKITVTRKEEVEVCYLLADVEPRYFEDAEIDGVSDENGTLTPCVSGNLWQPLIELRTGKILNWAEGKTAKIHFKVCDQGIYKLLDAEKNVVKKINGYVPNIMCPKGRGYGDYIIMDVDATGQIDQWKVDLEAFTDGD